MLLPASVPAGHPGPCELLQLGQTDGALARKARNVTLGPEEHLHNLLDVAKKAAQSDTTELDDEQDIAISNKDSKIDEEKIHLNASEIKDIYVRLSSLLYYYFNVQTCQSVHLYNHLFIHLFIGTITSSNFS